MRKPFVLFLVALAALGGAQRAQAGPLSSINWFNHDSYSATCDFVGPNEAALMEFEAHGATINNALGSDFDGAPFSLAGTARTNTSGVFVAASSTLTIQTVNGAYTAQLGFGGGTRTGLCRPWLQRISVTVSEGPYVATWPDGTREIGKYSLVYGTSSAGLVLSLVFRFDELIRPTPPPVDTRPPTLQLPEDMTVEATGPDGAVVAFAASATWPDGRTAAAACAPATRSTFPLGTTTVECSADGVSGSFDVTVVDTTPPAITLPKLYGLGAVSVNLFKSNVRIGTTGFHVTWPASATDVVDGDVGVTCTPASGFEFPMGSTEVVCEAVDARGNRAERRFVLVLPSVVEAYDQLVEVIRETFGLAAATIESQLTVIRSVLVRAEESATPQLLAAVKTQLYNLAYQLKQNPVTRLVFADAIRWIELQVGVVKVRMWSKSRQLTKTLRDIVSVCGACGDVASVSELLERAVEEGALSEAQQYLAQLESLVREYRRQGLLSSIAAGVLLNVIADLEQQLRVLEQAARAD